MKKKKVKNKMVKTKIENKSIEEQLKSVGPKLTFGFSKEQQIGKKKTKDKKK